MLKNIFEKNSNEEKPQENSNDLTSSNIKKLLSKSPDIKFREIFINDDKNLPVTMIYIDGMTNPMYVSDFILKPLNQEDKFCDVKNLSDAYKLIENGAIYFAAQIKSDVLTEVINEILSGASVLVFDELKRAIVFDTKGYEKRAIIEPTSENVTKGPKDSFIEVLRVNTSTLRAKIKSKNLVIEQTVVGKQTATPVSIIYMDNIANVNIVNAVREKLNGLDVDNVLSPSYIESALSSNIYSVFPQVKATERPDVLSADLLEGRVGVIVDGIPLAFVVPTTFIQLLQAPEDYSRNFIVSSLVRMLRYDLLFLTLTLPAFYIAVSSFNPELLPTDLVISIAESKIGVPFPSFFETLLMLLAFEVIFEAGLRMPKNIGQTVSIVGALIVGQAAVQAKIISPAVVILIAFTAIASFTMPNQDLSNAVRVWRFILAICSSILGLFGLIIGLIVMTYNLCKLEVYGIPYLSPLVSSKERILDDTLIRFPIKFMKLRPDELNVKNKKREG